MARADQHGLLLQTTAMPVLANALPIRLTLLHLGASPFRPPSFTGGRWPDHLAWGVDSISAAVRLLIAVQPVGAALLARTQLERWSANLAHNSHETQKAGEETAEWLGRLWSAPGNPPTVRSRDVSRIYADLSDVLHGRGPLMPLVWLDVADVTAAPSATHIRLIDTITDALVCVASRVQACAAGAASEDPSLTEDAQQLSLLPPITRSGGFSRSITAAILPLIPSHFAVLQRPLGALETGYSHVAAAYDKARQPDEPPQMWPLLAFGDQRFRALQTAQAAFERERRTLGDDFDADGIEGLETDAVLAGEMAAMLATWMRDDPEQQHPAAAFATCASALRSAVWLWLEDDDRAMGCLRCVIEQLARAWTWRLKPARAAKPEHKTTTTPRDWLEQSGWRRLRILSRALGEFAHGSPSLNPSVARGALVALQDDADDPIARWTGRTHAVTVLIFMVQRESLLWSRARNAELGDAYDRVTRIDEQRAALSFEKLLDRAWTQRDIPLRPSTTTETDKLRLCERTDTRPN